MAPEEAAGYLLALLGVRDLALVESPPRYARPAPLRHSAPASRAARRLLILAVEDLHWSDVLSAEWLTALVERMGTSPC